MIEKGSWWVQLKGSNGRALFKVIETGLATQFGSESMVICKWMNADYGEKPLEEKYLHEHFRKLTKKQIIRWTLKNG